MASRFASATSEEINQINILVYMSEASTREARQRSTMGMKIGNLSSRENMVITSAYEETNAFRTDSGGGSKECHLFSAGFVGKKNLFRYLSCQRTFGDVEVTFKIEFI